MSDLSEIVSITITSETLGVATAVFNIPMIPSVSATWTERSRIYESIDDVGGDFATDSPEYLCAAAVFAQDPSPDEIVIGRFVGKPTQAYAISVTAVGVGSLYSLNVVGQGVTNTTVSYTALANITLGAISGNDFTATAHGMASGDGPFYVSNSGGALPTGLTANTPYWIIAVDANTIAFASSKANALVPTAIALSGGTGTDTLVRTSNDVIVQQLVAGLNAVTGANYTAATAGSAGSLTLTVTVNAAGDWVSIEVTNIALLDNKQTHAEPSPSIATDLAAVQLENDTWYGAVYPFPSDACVKAFSSAIEATGDKIYIADVCWSETATTVVGNGDTADALKTLDRKRTAVMFHSGPNYFAAAAWMGATFPIDPGSDDWMFQQPSGVPAMKLTATHRANIEAKHANSIYTWAGQAITFQGTMADGEYIDSIRGIDWIENDMQVRLFNLLLKSRVKKLPYTAQGIALVANEVRASLKTAWKMGIINQPAPSDVQVPALADISGSDIANRSLPGVAWQATLQGSVHKITIKGSVSA